MLIFVWDYVDFDFERLIIPCEVWHGIVWEIVNREATIPFYFATDRLPHIEIKGATFISCDPALEDYWLSKNVCRSSLHWLSVWEYVGLMVVFSSGEVNLAINFGQCDDELLLVGCMATEKPGDVFSEDDYSVLDVAP